jgi:hypothetical protein
MEGDAGANRRDLACRRDVHGQQDYFAYDAKDSQPVAAKINVEGKRAVVIIANRNSRSILH